MILFRRTWSEFVPGWLSQFRICRAGARGPGQIGAMRLKSSRASRKILSTKSVRLNSRFFAGAGEGDGAPANNSAILRAPCADGSQRRPSNSRRFVRVQHSDIPSCAWCETSPNRSRKSVTLASPSGATNTWLIPGHSGTEQCETLTRASP
jgi:hypothetical protein